MIGHIPGIGESALAQTTSSAREDLALILPDFIRWCIDPTLSGGFSTSEQWGLPGDQFLAGEPLATYRNKLDELVVVRPEPSTGRLLWYVKLHDSAAGFSGRYVACRYGAIGDRALIADFDGDGQDEAATVGFSTRWPGGLFFNIDSNSNLIADRQAGNPDVSVYWPVPLDSADVVLAGHFGVKAEEVAIWRYATGRWELYTSYLGKPTTAMFANPQFGLPGDIPVVGDFNGDGFSDLAVFRPNRNPNNNLLFINYYERGAAQAGYGPDGDVDRIVNYQGAINGINIAVNKPGQQWNIAAIALKHD